MATIADFVAIMFGMTICVQIAAAAAKVQLAAAVTKNITVRNAATAPKTTFTAMNASAVNSVSQFVQNAASAPIAVRWGSNNWYYVNKKYKLN